MPARGTRGGGAASTGGGVDQMFSVRQTVLVFSADCGSRLLIGIAGLLLIRFMAPIEYAAYILATSIFSFVMQAASTAVANTYIITYERLGLGGRPLALLGLQLGAAAALAVVIFPASSLPAPLYAMLILSILGACLVDFSKARAQRELHFGRYSALEMLRSVSLFGSFLAIIGLRGASLRATEVFAVQAAAMGFAFLLGVVSRAGALGGAGLWGAALTLRQIFIGPYRFLLGYMVLLAVYGQIDVWSLTLARGAHDVGAYGSAQRYYLLLGLALSSFQAVLLPTLQKVSSRAEVAAVFRKHRFLLLVFAPTILATAVAAPEWIPFVDAGKYPEAVAIYRVFALSAVVSFAFSPHATLLYRFEQFGFLFRLGLVMAAWHAMASWLAASRGNALVLASVHAVDYGAFNLLIYLRSRGLMRSAAQLPALRPSVVPDAQRTAE